jgi:hypothetical protein
MEDSDFLHLDLPMLPTRPLTSPMPSVTESILRCMEISCAEENGRQFVRTINDMEAELERTSDARRFVDLYAQLKECWETAKTCMEQYQRLADIWTGAEFNLGQFLGGIPQEQRDRMMITAQAEEEQRRTLAAEMERVNQVQEGILLASVNLEELENDIHAGVQRRARRNRRRPEHTLAVTEVTDIPESTPVISEVPTLPAVPAVPTLPTPALTLPELIAQVENEAQKQALSKLLLRNDANQMYLAAYEANGVTRGRGSDVEGTFTVLGTMRHGARESYAVKWHRLAPGRPSFWCNCPDHKFNSRRKNMVCKHICFLVSKVGRILDPVFYASRQFTEVQQAQFREVVGNAAIFSDGARERERLAAHPVFPTIVPTISATSTAEARRAQFMEVRRSITAEDTCPICYDEMGNTVCLNCPTCSNNVHRECMEVWLERHSTCVYCRSDVWRAWN